MPPTRETPAATATPRRAAWLFPLLLVLAVGVVYWNSLRAPFQFDDEPAIVFNPTIRSFGTALQPPADGAGVTGRPVVNLTLAVNYALGGLEPRGYHAVNLALHALAALALWGVLRRTLARLALPDPDKLAWCIALIWAVHPLQTESVTNVVQRAESLAGLFYLFTLYAFLRGVEGAGCLRCRVVSVVACLLGMASKEVMVLAPLVVLLYDRTFVAGSFRAAWSARWRYYVALAATWLPLAWLVAATQGRGGSAGFATEISPWHYLLTQCDAIVHYVRLSFWPHPLVLDYGMPLVKSLGEVWWQALLLVAAFGAVLWALVRRPAAGFLGICFFALLAPSSSFVPVATQTMAEHRMYLALSVLVCGVMIGLQRILGQKALILAAVMVIGLVTATIHRNQDYHDALRLWKQTAAAAPSNPRAHLNLGQTLFRAGQMADAEQHFAEAVRLKPDYAEAHYNLGLTLSQRGQLAEAINHFEAALQLAPDYAVAHNDLGIAYAGVKRPTEAQAQFEAALRLRPDFAGARFNLGNLLLRTGRPADAIPHYEAAVGLNGDLAEYHASLAMALMQVRRAPEAIAHYQKAVERSPDSPELRLSLALALATTGRLREAIPPLEEALRLRPDFAPARHYLLEIQTDLKRLEAPRR